MQSTRTVQAVVLASVPEGVPVATDFTTTEQALPEVGPGQVRVAVRDLSLDPYIRSTLGGSHLGDAPVKPGGVVGGRAVGEVVESRSDSLAVGDLVVAETGWVSEAVVEASAATKVDLPSGVPASAALGVLGMPGLTAYAALERHVMPAAGETVVVSSATGGVGALAGQLLAAAGARPVAIVGSREKAALATQKLGYAAAVVRGSDTFADDLRAACPDKVNGYLHMGDQATLDVVMEQLAVGARVSLIGVMDQSNGAPATRVRAGAVMAARATLMGMVIYDHFDLAAEHVAKVGALVAAGEIAAFEDRTVGLDQAGAAFARMMSGANVGKAVVEVSRRV
ncbi:MDR family NADP-dependent oxidoreductase [Nocardioides gilvus]|uniref:MDR family NADP-dependent oxidoreductase n=1 Tax=Nocardioides gilvus TaxID=1735589 RepID=UPI000D74F515|nr:NADP-dependent oxidoreductase [Nocardioides gilvus]